MAPAALGSCSMMLQNAKESNTFNGSLGDKKKRKTKKRERVKNRCKESQTREQKKWVILVVKIETHTKPTEGR